MSETPRTNAAAFWARDMGQDSASPHEQCVGANFAQELERENAELRQRVEAMRGYLLHIKVLASTILTSEEQLEEKR